MKENYKCNYCDKTSTCKTSINVHIRKVHGDKIIKCQICENKAFQNLRGILSHVSKIHKNITTKNYYDQYITNKPTCKLKDCGKVIEHENLRYGDYCCQGHANASRISDIKYICQICKQPFKAIQNLSNHITDTHKDITAEQYYNLYLNEKNDLTGKCLSCQKPLKFKSLIDGYYKFCHNTNCNVNYYNKLGRSDCGDKISKGQKETQNMPNQIGYWIKKGYNEDQAKALISERQATNSVESIMRRQQCNKQQAEGIRQDITEKWLHTLDQKSDEEKLRIKDLKIQGCINNMKNDNHPFISRPEKELAKLLNLEENTQLSLKDNDNYYIYDMYKNKKIIEFNGDYWHANPKKYQSEQIIKYPKNKSYMAQEIWKRDQKKIEFAKNLDYEVLIVWECDYNENRDQVIQTCKEFLNE